MERLNIVTGLDRERGGRVIRLCVGVADLTRSAWLSGPVTIGAESVIDRIKAGETFRCVLNGALGPRLRVAMGPDGEDSIMPMDEEAQPITTRMDGLPPC